MSRPAAHRHSGHRESDHSDGRGLVVAVIGGGTNCEHDVSRASARAAVAALRARGCVAVDVTIRTDGGWEWDGDPCDLSEVVSRLATCDAVLPLVHGAGGEDGTLAALCELVGVPYVGSGVRAGAVAMDKALTKGLAASLGVPTAPGRAIQPGSVRDLGWEGPVVVKPVAAGSSFGVSLVEHPDELDGALEAAWAVGGAALVEQRMIGREIGITVYGGETGITRTTAPLEVMTEGIFDSGRKYDGHAVFQVPADLSDAELESLRRHATSIYGVLECQGPVRIDFFLTDDGWCLNELNTTPGMTEHSQVPRMFAAEGVSYGELLERIVRSAIDSRMVRRLTTAQ